MAEEEGEEPLEPELWDDVLERRRAPPDPPSGFPPGMKEDDGEIQMQSSSPSDRRHPTPPTRGPPGPGTMGHPGAPPAHLPLPPPGEPQGGDHETMEEGSEAGFRTAGPHGLERGPGELQGGREEKRSK